MGEMTAFGQFRLLHHWYINRRMWIFLKQPCFRGKNMQKPCDWYIKSITIKGLISRIKRKLKSDYKNWTNLGKHQFELDCLLDNQLQRQFRNWCYLDQKRGLLNSLAWSFKDLTCHRPQLPDRGWFGCRLYFLRHGAPWWLSSITCVLNTH